MPLQKKRKVKKKLTNRQKDSNSTAYRNWRKAVLARDMCCVVCGAKRTLNVHHLYAYAIYPNLRHDVNNGVTVCHKHHKLFHSIYGNRTTLRDFQHFVKNHKR